MDDHTRNLECPRAGPLTGAGRPTRALVDARARAIAAAAGRIPPLVLQADYEQAKREVTGQADRDRQDALLDSSWEPGLAVALPPAPGR